MTVPVPEKEPDAYIKALKILAYEEDADLFVPICSPVASIYDARIANVLPSSCRSLSLTESMTVALDDKVNFCEVAKACNLPAPDTRRMQSKDEVMAFNEKLNAEGESAKQYVLKNLSYDSMRRLDVFKLPCDSSLLASYISDIEITPATPWAVQAFIKGTEYSTCAIAHDGALALYTDNEASISCFNYSYKGDPRLRNWVKHFCAANRLTGILCIDFFIDEAGTPLAIECNPRMSSNITNFHNSPTAWRAFIEPEELVKSGKTELPLPSAVETCWTACDVYYALVKPGYGLKERCCKVRDIDHNEAQAFHIDGH